MSVQKGVLCLKVVTGTALSVAFDKLTILGNVDNLTDFIEMLLEEGFEKAPYESSNYGYGEVYKHDYIGYVEVAEIRGYKEPDILRLIRNRSEINRKREIVQAGKAPSSFPSLEELNSALDDTLEKIGQCDDEGYLKRIVRKDIRFEYNPKYALYDAEVEGIQNRIVNVMKDKHCTQTHIAIDYSYDISKLIIIDTVARKENTFKGRNKKLETVYLGVRSSDNHLCIYNKKQENKDKGTIDQYPELKHITRFEARLKGKKIESFLKGDFNPFEKILVLDYEDMEFERLEGNERYRVEAMMYRIERGIDPFYDIESRATKKRMRELMESVVKVKLKPSEDFEQKKGFLVGRLESILENV